MKLPYFWLAELVENLPPAEELAEILTMRGFEIEEINAPGEEIQDVVIGKILDCQPHPNADKLSFCQVTDGSETYGIVCGASNMQEGDCVALARVGSVLPGNFKIEKRKIRGQTSLGMMCSTRELGLGEDHSGIMILPGNAPLGQRLVDYLGLNDIIFDINVTPNRPDALSALGIAREVAAACNSKVTLPECSELKPETDSDSQPVVELGDEELCPRYTALIIKEIQIGSSPEWLKARLEACGVRSVNNVVDITNLVLMELGQPLHAFDLNKLTDQKIVVRRAKKGETLVSIDGEERKLDDEMLAIADAKSPVAIAGVMGGLDSEVGDGTTAILLESAYFKPASVRRTSKKLGLSSEASYRFERGVDFDMVIPAAWRCARLITELAGGKIAGSMTVADSSNNETIERLHGRDMTLDLDYCTRLLGQDIPADDVENIFNSLNLNVQKKETSHLIVQIPSYRQDIVRQADLVEEVARCYGYNRFEPTLPSMPVKAPEPMPVDRMFVKELRDYLTSAGLDEAVTYSFIDNSLMPPFQQTEAALSNNATTMLNPLSSKDSTMRTSILPSLLLCAKRNVAHGNPHFGLFELGRNYLPNGEEVNEHPVLGAVIVGNPSKDWRNQANELDCFAVKGIVEGILGLCGVKNYRNVEGPKALHPKRGVGLQLGKDSIGYFGELHPNLVDNYELNGRVLVFELTIKPLSDYYRKYLPQFKTYSTFPSVRRDMALLVPQNAPAQKIEKIVRREGGDLLEDLNLFDYYKGKQVTEGYVSLAFRLTFRSMEGTLKEEEIDQRFEKITNALKKELDVQLRS